MPLLGNAAMLLSFDIVDVAIAEHDDWHTHEHLPERLSIPGFRRGTRWVSPDAKPRYFVMYEVDEISTLQSNAYLERLDNPSPWTTRMMPNYRGMSRGLCSVPASFGQGIGQCGLLIRFKPQTGMDMSLRAWLIDDILPRLPPMRGIGGAHLFEGAVSAQMTNEQRIRGADADVDQALFVTGYDEDAVARLRHGDLSNAEMQKHGSTAVSDGMYRMHYSLSDRDVRA